MPIYEYYCWECNDLTEELRPMADRDKTPPCFVCGGETERIASVPIMHIWNNERRFPNVSNFGDGSKTFESKSDYKLHLKENHMAEFSTDAPVKNSHGAEVTVFK